MPCRKHAPHTGTREAPPPRARKGRVRLVCRGEFIIALVTIRADLGGTHHSWETEPMSTAHDTHTASRFVVQLVVVHPIINTYGNTELGSNNS